MLVVAVLSGCNGPATQETVTVPPAPPTQPVASSAPEPTQTNTGFAIPDGPPSFTLPFHDGTLLRVYNAPKDNDQGRADYGIDDKETLVRYDPRTRIAKPIGRIAVVTGGNYGGIFVPVGITRDDARIVLRAHMMSPGAGGGSVDLGYGFIDVAGPAADREVKDVATAEATFIDGYGAVVFVTEGDNTPRMSPPGPGNDAALAMRVVGREDVQTLLAERDTTYALVSVDERARTVTYDAKHYTFSPSCPRQDDNLYCAKTTTKRGTLKLP